MIVQLSDIELTARTLVMASQILVILLGFTIVYIAFQGYRRNRSRPMLFIAVGFTLIIGVQAISAGVYVVFDVSELAAGAVSQAAQLSGLICILYALRMEG
ncbi:hypothetical protein [Halostella sp. PRR32]|uniref:DUF7521 family protein n=1 Tax=Halostella sp. PRR32 TaxID=3098147 RepID=UPI002B1DC987|nr:hypothetical protein [Halostella sp. PRR32]